MEQVIVHGRIPWPGARQWRPQVVGNIVADTGQSMDHGLHLVEHTVDDSGQP